MKISVITPAIDRADFIDEAITSVPRSGNFALEHIVVHDGQTPLSRPFGMLPQVGSHGKIKLKTVWRSGG